MDTVQDGRKVIEEIVMKIISHYAPLKVVLFGSYAYGQPHEESDIDLLIIKETDKRPLERWTEVKKLLRDRNRSIRVTPLVYTPQEVEDRLARKDFFIQEILEDGTVLYG
jgi:uncharacterized protein